MCNVKKNQCCPNILEMKIDIAKIFRIWIRRFSCLFKGGRNNNDIRMRVYRQVRLGGGGYQMSGAQLAVVQHIHTFQPTRQV